MTTPSDDASRRVDLDKTGAGDAADDDANRSADESFDPYRFGAPDVPPPPEYAPPGYKPPPDYPYPAAGTSGPHGSYPPYPYGTTAGQAAGAPGPAPSVQSPYGQTPYGQTPYGQTPHGPPPYGPYGPTPYGPSTQAAQSNGKAVAGLVLGIVSIVFFWTTFLDAIFVILGLIFSLLGLGDARNRGGRGRGQALAGVICTGVGAVLAIVFTVFLVHLANKCGGLDNQNTPGYNQCLRDHI